MLLFFENASLKWRESIYIILTRSFDKDDFKEDNFKEDNFKEDDFKKDDFKEDYFKEDDFKVFWKRFS